PVPADRFESMTELLSALERAMVGEAPIDAAHRVRDDVDLSGHARPGRWWLIAVAIVATVGLTGLAIQRSRDGAEVVYQACNIRVDGSLGVISNAWVSLDRGQVWQVDVADGKITFQ